MKKNIEKAQEKQKKYHDKRIKNRNDFKVGQKVLLFRQWKDKIHTGKFEEKWEGPYLIHEDLNNGSFKLKTLQGKIFRRPQNGEFLKKFYERTKFIN